MAKLNGRDYIGIFDIVREGKALNWQEGELREEVMRVIPANYDVASYYPHLMVLYGYSSRNIPSPETFC